MTAPIISHSAEDSHDRQQRPCRTTCLALRQQIGLRQAEHVVRARHKQREPVKQRAAARFRSLASRQRHPYGVSVLSNTGIHRPSRHLLSRAPPGSCTALGNFGPLMPSQMWRALICVIVERSCQTWPGRLNTSTRRAFFLFCC